MEHWKFWHTEEPLVLAGHLMPQPPQFSVSVARFTHDVPQVVSPLPHEC